MLMAQQLSFAWDKPETADGLMRTNPRKPGKLFPCLSTLSDRLSISIFSDREIHHGIEETCPPPQPEGCSTQVHGSPVHSPTSVVRYRKQTPHVVFEGLLDGYVGGHGKRNSSRPQAAELFISGGGGY